MLEKQNKYSIRKLTVGAASVLIGASFFAVNGKTVKADTVNDTNNVDSNKVVQEGIKEKAPESTQDGLLKGTDKIEKNSGLESGANANTSATQVNQDSSVVKDGQQAGGVNGTLQTSAPAKQGVPAIGITQKQDNTVNNGVKAPETQTLNLKSLRNIKLNAVSLQDSKVQTQNATTNGGFDEATWGKLDVNSWKGQAENGVYQLTDYTGDLAHIIVPNAADFAAAGKDIGGLQVGINADTTHGWFTKADPKTIAFSKTGGEKVKAVGKDWTAAFTGSYLRAGYSEYGSHWLNQFDGSNLDVSNVTDMKYMFSDNQISDLNPLANWKINNVTNMRYMFDRNQISDLSPLANWKTDKVTDMSYMFENNQISDLSPLANWKTDKVTSMSCMFNGNQISDLSPLANWKTDNVTSMSYMFQLNQISDLSPLANWKTDNVTDMSNMFMNDQISDLSPLANWKTGKVTSMSCMFNSNQISDLSPLASWNISNIIDMSWMFENNQISDLSPLANWKTNNVTYMYSMFQNNQIKDLSPLTNWKTNNVTDMSYMFENNQISDLNGLAKWNISNVTGMAYMFRNNPIQYADFTKWNFDQVKYLANFINQINYAIILVKNAQDQSKLAGESQGSTYDSTLYPVVDTPANTLHFGDTDTSSMPTILIATNKSEARQQLLSLINSKVSDYQKLHSDDIVTPAVPLDNLTELANLANAKFNVVPNVTTVTVHFFDDIGTNQDNAPKDITLNNQVVGQVLTIDAIKDNPELANYNLVPGASYTIAENTPWLVHVTHKISEHDASLPATRTICVHRPDGTTQTTVQTIGYKYTVTHDLVTNQDFNSEPIFDKDTTETVVTTVDKNGKSTSQTDNSTVFYTKASDGKYYNFNSFKLPTFPGYKIHMTANSSGIEISYARQHLNAINFVDSTDPSNIVKTYNVSGFTGQTVATDISNNIPENWEIVPGSNYPSNITFSTNDQEDTPINIQVQHKYVNVTTGDGTTETLSRNIYTGKTDFTGSTAGQELKKLETQTVTLHRTGTKDLVTDEINWNPYTPVAFEAISAPIVPGYTLSNPNDCKPLTVDGFSHVDDVYLVYKPNKHTQVFNYVDKNGTVEGTYSVDGYTDQTFPTDTNYVTDNIPSGWMQVPGSTYPLTLAFGPNDPAPINVQVQRRYVDVTTGDGTTVDLHRDIYTDEHDFSGSVESKKVDTQIITLHRTGTKDLVTGAIEWNPYSSGTFDAISAPTIPGYTLDNPNDCGTFPVDGSVISDGAPTVIDVHLVYYPGTHTQVFNYVDENGTVVASPYSVYGYTGQTVDVDINTIASNVPGGYQMVPGSIPSSITFGPDDPAPIVIHVQEMMVSMPVESEGHTDSLSGTNLGDMFMSDFVIMPTNSATNFAIMPTDSTSLTLPKIADSVQVPQSKNVQKEDDVIQRTVKPHAAILKQELDSLVKTAALPSVKLNKQNLKELKQIFVNNNPKDLRSISWKLQDSVLSSSTPLYTLSNSSNSIMLPHLTGYKFKLIKRGTGENSVSFVYSKDKNYKYVFNIAFKDNVMYFTVLTPNKAHTKLTVKQVYKVHNQKELANILSLYL